MTSDVQSKVAAGLDSRPRLKEALGKQVLERAAQRDALVNRHIQSLYGWSRLADIWESTLRRIPAASLSRFKTLRLTDDFDTYLEDCFAEVRAMQIFQGKLSATVECLPEKTKAADFGARWDGKLAVVEVKRAKGLADHLLLAESALDAAKRLHSDIVLPRLVVYATDAYHQDRLRQAFDPGRELQIRRDLRELLYRERYAEIAHQLSTVERAALSGDLLWVTISIGRGGKPNKGGVGLAPFAPQLPRGLSETMGSLEGLAGVLRRARDAVPQLAASAQKSNEPVIQVAYICHDAWEFSGLELGSLDGILAQALQWNKHLAMIVHPIDDDICAFGRNAGGAMKGFDRVEQWGDYVAIPTL